MMLVAGVALLVGALLGVGVMLVVRRTRRAVESFESLRRVRVHLRGDEYTVEGLLRGVVGGFVVLVNAAILVSDSDTVSVEGSLEVPIVGVAFIEERVG